MLSLEALLLITALTAGGDIVLLDFSAPWCGPCRSMEPTVQRLTAAGYPVQQINVDQQSQLAQQYRVSGIPCFVLLAGGQEVTRLEGAASYDRLVQMFHSAGFQPASAGSMQVRAQSPEPAGRFGGRLRALGGGLRATTATAPPDAPAALPPVDERFAHATAAPPMMAAPAGLPTTPSAAPVAQQSNLAQQRALHATVRLKVEDAAGHSFGTGTIIDVHGEEALVVTCGHIFRDSQGKGQISVDLFMPGARGPVPGQLISYDAAERDIALVSIRPGVSVQPASVAPAGHHSQAGQAVFSIGCDRGGDPSIRPSQVTAVDKYLGAPNIEVAGQPVDGRSGGGLFSADGLLIGVCNAADPADNEGVYAGLPTIHWQLDQIGLSHVYQQRGDALAQATPASEPGVQNVPVESWPASAGAVPEAGRQADVTPVSYTGLDAIRSEPSGEQELICIVRSQEGQEIMIVQQPSPELMARLSEELRNTSAAAR